MRDQPPYPSDVKALQECLIDGEESDLDVVDTNSFMGQLHVSHVSLCILSYYPPEAYNKQFFFLSIISDFFGREARRRKMTTRSPAP